MPQLDRIQGRRAEDRSDAAAGAARAASSPAKGEARSVGRFPPFAALLVTLGVGGMLLLLFAAHAFPANRGDLQAGAALWFIGVGLLKVVFDLRRGL